MTIEIIATQRTRTSRQLESHQRFGVFGRHRRTLIILGHDANARGALALKFRTT